MGNQLDHYDWCVLCGERIAPFGDRAEMYDPTEDDVGGVVHADCGLNAGWEIA